MTAVNLFLCYSHEDDTHRANLDNHLSALKREGLIATWHDRMILSGREWEVEIDENIKSCEVIALLVSSDFIASDYCYEKEMKIAMERHESGDAIVIPIILRACLWEVAPFGKLEAAPEKGKPITNKEWGTADDAWLDVAVKLRKILKDISSRRNQNLQALELRNIDDLMKNEIDAIEEIYDSGPDIAVRDYSTGLTSLDILTGGLPKGELTLISGIEDMGHSDLVLHCARFTAINSGIPTLIVSASGAENVSRRIMSSESRVPLDRMVLGMLSSEDWERLARGATKIKGSPILINDKGESSLEEILNRATPVKEAENISLVVVDGFNCLINQETRSLSEAASRLAHKLSEFAKKHDVAVLIACDSSIDPNNRPNKRPMLLDLEIYGTLTSYCNTIVFLYREEYYNEYTKDRGIAELTTAKNNYLNYLDTQKVLYVSEYSSFENLRNDLGTNSDS